MKLKHLLLIIVPIFVGLVALNTWYTMYASCSWFAWRPLSDVPLRCLPGVK